jgi:hypothetical protein
LSEVELGDLDPTKDVRPRPRTGLRAIQDAIRQAQDGAIYELIAAARLLPPSDAPADRAAAALRALNEEVAHQREDPYEDPFWRTVRDRVIEVGAAFVALLDEPLDDPQTERVISSDVRLLAPQRVRAGVGGELWTLLTDYYLRDAEKYEGPQRHRSAIAVVAMAMEELIAIDDIDPRDFYEDEDA